MDKKVTSVKEVQTNVFPWGQITWVHGAEVSGSEELTVGEVIINPGMENPYHSHPNCEEVLFLISGELVHTLGDDEPHRMGPGMSIRASRNIKHNAKCISAEPARMVVAYSSARRETENE